MKSEVSRFKLMVCIALLAGLVSCKKSGTTPARFLVHNASWSAGAISALWNGQDITGNGLSQGSTTGLPGFPYQLLPGGTNLFAIKEGTTKLLEKNLYVKPGIGQSLFFYDSSPLLPELKIVFLTDDLTLPDSGNSKIRFINFVPDTSLRVDFSVVSATDSIRLDSASQFIELRAFNSYEVFNVYKVAKNYTVMIRKSGTGELLSSIPDFPFESKGVYSIVFSGLPGGTGGSTFRLSVIPHRSQ
ncbi:MAG: DUF4397 domain-containing protein [Gemmatimonadaceae bacterium]|nr:DUF4397 domain-containing protein [Chitinophagaceae bacterium]